MADGKHWFKVWHTILTDPGMEEQHNQIIGVWTRLGALVSTQGEKGTLTLSLSQFKKRCHLSDAESVTIEGIIEGLKSINCEVTICNSVCTVTFKKWHKYQVDSSAERVSKYRQSVTVQEEKRREEIRRDKIRRDNSNITSNKIFVKPTVDDVRIYCIERENNISPETFCAFYESKGWKVGRSPMKNWQAAIRTWENKNKEATNGKSKGSSDWSV